MRGEKLSVAFATGETMGEMLGCYDLVVMAVSRREVEEGAIGDVVDRLMQLSDTRESTLKFESRLIMTFDGWDEDPRELCEIPEVVAFFEKVNGVWPHWYHFLRKDLWCWQWLMSMLIETERATLEGGQVVRAMKDQRRAQERLINMFVPMNALYGLHGIGEAKNRQMTNEVAGMIEKFLG